MLRRAIMPADAVISAFRTSLASSGLGENAALEERLDALLLNFAASNKSELSRLLQESGVHKLGHHYRVLNCLKVAAAATSAPCNSDQPARAPNTPRYGLLEGLPHLSQRATTMKHLQNLVLVAEQSDAHRQQGLRFFCEAAEVTLPLCVAADERIAQQLPAATEAHGAHATEWAKTFQIW